MGRIQAERCIFPGVGSIARGAESELFCSDIVGTASKSATGAGSLAFEDCVPTEPPEVWRLNYLICPFADGPVCIEETRGPKGISLKSRDFVSHEDGAILSKLCLCTALIPF